MTDICEIIRDARKKGASDIHISEAMPLWYRVNGRLREAELQPSPEEVRSLLLSLLSERHRAAFEAGEDADFSLETPEGERQRVNVFRQQKKLAATIRLLNGRIPSLEDLKMPTILYEMAKQPRGLILVTGPTGSGKSTTLAAMIEYLNRNLDRHVITIEDPIEYRYESKRSLIHQREVGEDVGSFASALRSALREDPDVILVGEMRDLETISTALTAAETGHLVLSTLHTISADKTIDRIIDVFPPNQQQQVRIQLASVLECIVSQQLIRREDGRGRVAALEVLFANTAIRNMIRENKTYQIISTMQTGKRQGMQTMDDAIYELFLRGDISADSAVSYAQKPGEMSGKVNFDMP